MLRAASPFRVENSQKQDRGPRGGRAAQDRSNGAIWTDWARVEEVALGLRMVLVRVPNDGFPLEGVYEMLASMPGVRQVLETKEDREIIATALLRPGEDEEDLRARIAEHLPGRAIRLHVIGRATEEPAAATWLGLAKRELEEGT